MVSSGWVGLNPVNPVRLYPPVRDPRLKKAASNYAGEKGNLRFPLDKPIPYGLIAHIVKARLKEGSV